MSWITAIWKGIESYFFNPLMVLMLKTPVHRLLSHRFMTVSYDGRTSGSRITFPVGYVRDDSTFIVVTTREETVWWTNFKSPHPASLQHRGQQIAVEGEAFIDRRRVTEGVEQLCRDSSLYRFLLGDPDDELNWNFNELVVVHFRPIDQPS